MPLDKIYGYKSVYEECKKLKINVEKPKRFNQELIKKIKTINPDYIFSVYYRAIFPQSLLSLFPGKCINIHPGPLPNYRGPTPTAWAILNGEKNHGITIHEMDQGIDTGSILVQKKYAIKNDETGYELYTRTMDIGFELLKDNFRKIISGKLKSKKQTGSGSYFGKMNPTHNISWQDTVQRIYSMIRVHSKPYNPAQTSMFNHYFLINKAKIVNKPRYKMQGAGKIIGKYPNGKLLVSCADGCLLLEDFEAVPKLSKQHKDIYYKIGNNFN